MSICNALRESPPNSAAAQALLDLTGELPEDSPAPLYGTSRARQNAADVARVAEGSEDPDILTALARSDSRVSVRMGLLRNPALPDSELPALVEWFMGRKFDRSHAKEFLGLSPQALTAVTAASLPEPPHGLLCASAVAASKGCLAAARVLEDHMKSVYIFINTGCIFTPDTVRLFHDAGLHTMAACAYAEVLRVRHKMNYGTACLWDESIVRPALESLLQADRRTRSLFQHSPDVDIPDDLLPDIADEYPHLACRTLRDMPEDVLITHAELLLRVGWVQSGRWSNLAHWTPGIWNAVTDVLSAYPERADVWHTFYDLLAGTTVAMPGVDTLPLHMWATRSRDPYGVPRPPVTHWWLQHSAGRPRTVDEAVNLVRAARKSGFGEKHIARLAEVLLVDCRDMWSGSELEVLAGELEADGDYTWFLELGLDVIGPASVLGDNVAAWKLFYSLTEGDSSHPMQLARTAVELTGQ